MDGKGHRRPIRQVIAAAATTKHIGCGLLKSISHPTDGRIDDPNGGWKGKGLWATTSTRAPFHMEGGKGTRPKVVKFQLRPDPLAR
jgi:hypothetical protein